MRCQTILPVFGIGRFERPNKSAHLNSNFEDSPHLVTVDHPSSIGSLAGGQHLAPSPNSFQLVLWTNRRRIRETRHGCISVSTTAKCGR